MHVVDMAAGKRSSDYRRIIYATRQNRFDRQWRTRVDGIDRLIDEKCKTFIALRFRQCQSIRSGPMVAGFLSYLS